MEENKPLPTSNRTPYRGYSNTDKENKDKDKDSKRKNRDNLRAKRHKDNINRKPKDSISKLGELNQDSRRLLKRLKENINKHRDIKDKPRAKVLKDNSSHIRDNAKESIKNIKGSPRDNSAIKANTNPSRHIKDNHKDNIKQEDKDNKDNNPPDIIKPQDMKNVGFRKFLHSRSTIV